MRHLLLGFLLFSQIAHADLRSSSVGSGPAVIVISTVEGINDPSMTPLKGMLLGAGYRVIAVDFPCHGKGQNTDLGLECWRAMYEHGKTLDAFANELNNFATKENAVAMVGVSRAGFIALHVAALDKRGMSYVLISPVIDLGDLQEFRGAHRLSSWDAKLLPVSGKRIFLAIGKHDDRVSTESSVDFAKRFHAHLLLTNTEGHSHPPIDDKVVDWIKRGG